MKNALFVIANPAAGGGRGAKVVADVIRATAGRRDVTVHVTAKAGDETTFAHRAIARGATALIAVGGDGTWSKVGAALLESERRPPLALIAAGTGNDFAKTVGAPARDIARTLALIDSGQTRRVDAGTVEGRFFLVCCGFGFDTAVLERMRTVRGLRGSSRYLYAAMRELRSYAGFDVALAADGSASKSTDVPTTLLLLVIANAQHYGGAFRIAPHAKLTDGLLDCITLAPLGTLARAKLLLSATRGLHVWSPAVRELQQQSFALRFATPPMYNLDGDLYQARSGTLQVDSLRGALEVFAPEWGEAHEVADAAAREAEDALSSLKPPLLWTGSG